MGTRVGASVDLALGRGMRGNKGWEMIDRWCERER